MADRVEGKVTPPIDAHVTEVSQLTDDEIQAEINRRTEELLGENTRDLKLELLRLLQEKKRRQEVEIAQRPRAVLVHNRDGSVTVIKLQFVEAANGRPIS